MLDTATRIQYDNRQAEEGWTDASEEEVPQGNRFAFGQLTIGSRLPFDEFDIANAKGSLFGKSRMRLNDNSRGYNTLESEGVRNARSLAVVHDLMEDVLATTKGYSSAGTDDYFVDYILNSSFNEAAIHSIDSTFKTPRSMIIVAWRNDTSQPATNIFVSNKIDSLSTQETPAVFLWQSKTLSDSLWQIPSVSSGAKHLSAALQASFDAQPVEDGITHPAEEIINRAIHSAHERRTLYWLRAFCTELDRPAFAASVLLSRPLR